VERKRWTGLCLIDEAQEMTPTVFTESRLLSSVEPAFPLVLTTVPAGDQRLVKRLH
jgi:hypothetical protein